jgi:cold shock CspA family protein
MIPIIPELDQMEKLASSEEPSIEGAWAHTIQLVDHLYNSLSVRDPINNEVLIEKWSTMMELMNQLELQTSHRPIPFDTLHQLFEYCSKAIEKIAQNPSKKMIKETEMVSPNRLKSPRMKTINWIAKQPGRNIREKLAGKNRVLTEQNKYSIQTKENAVYLKVVKSFMAEFRNRLEYGINTMLFDVQERDNQLFDEIDEFLKTAPSLLRSELGKVQAIPVTQPNNMLISDKNYSVIWRTYQLLNARQSSMQIRWSNAIERYVCSIFIQLVARLAQFEEWILEDGMGKLFEEKGQFGVEQYEDTETTSFRFFRKSLEKGSIVMINRDQGYGFIKTKKHSKIYFHKSLLDEKTFNSLKSKDIVYIEWEQTSKGINAVSCSLKPIRYSITMSYHNKHVEMKLEKWERTANQVRYSSTTSKTWSYYFEQGNADPEVNRGIPVTITGYSSDVEGKILHVQNFADMTGINYFIDQIMLKLKKQFPLRERESDQEESMLIHNAGIDFTKAIPTVIVNGECWYKAPYSMIQFTRGNETLLSAPHPYHVYAMDKRVFSLNSTFHPKDAQYHSIMHSYLLLMAKLREKLPVQLQTPFIYLVPDNIDEFAQKDIKKALSVQFPTSFPIWRSVAGALAVERDILSAKADTILVIDTHGHEASAIKLIRKKHQNESYFQHYPPFEAPRKSVDVTLESYYDEYLKLYENKYHLSFETEEIDHLVQSGLLEKLLLSKEETVVFPHPQAAPIELVYDSDLAEQAQKRWLTSFSMYIHQLQELLREERVSKIDYIIVLGDHLFDKQAIKTLLKERFKINECSLVLTENAMAAVVNDNVNKKLAEGKTLWFEYLPDLSLEVVKNGHYSKLQLIKDKAIGNTMGIGKVFEVKEHLLLPKGNRTYRFPLIRGGASIAELDAIIKDASFPLRNDTEVKLSIEYKYGYENSYRLFIQPIQEKATFKQIEAEWVIDSELKLYKKSHLEIPTNIMPISDLEREIEKLTSFMESTEKVISRRLHMDFADKETLDRAHRLFYSTIYHLRRIVVQDHESAVEFIDMFYNRDLFEYCLEIDNYIAHHINESYKRDIQFFKNDIWRYLCSFGEHIHRDVWDYVICNLEKLDEKVGIALLYKNSDDEQLLSFLEKRIERNPLAVVRSIRDMLWRDEDLLQNIYQFNHKMIDAMYYEIYSGIERIYKRKLTLKPLVFRDYCEVMLALLALRDKPEFKYLKTGSTEMRKLAKYVRTIDAWCYEIENEPLRSYLQFDLQKPVDLWKMSDLAFVVNAYLTGELMDNLISVREISIE